MGRDPGEPVCLEEKLKAQNSLFLENCRIGDVGILYAQKDGEVLALQGTVRDIGVLPGLRDTRMFVTIELPFYVMSSCLSQMMVVNLINGQTDFYTVQ